MGDPDGSLTQKTCFFMHSVCDFQYVIRINDFRNIVNLCTFVDRSILVPLPREANMPLDCKVKAQFNSVYKARAKFRCNHTT